MPTFTVYKGSDGGKIVKGTATKPDELEEDFVLLKTTASGLCGTDLHYRGQDMALGHEGIGKVVAIGPAVKSLKVGDRVGWGYQHDACGSCKQCLSGWNTFCADRKMYGYADLDQGSFSTQAVWRESYLFKIPDSISDVDAAPLQCAGATVFNALQNLTSSDVVGIMGVGGLGHLAIQFAAKLGARVVVISGTSSKKEEAIRLGASDFIALKDESKPTLQYPITRLLVTTSALPDWPSLLPLLDNRATIYPLSVDEGDFKFPYMALLSKGIQVQGSIVAARQVHQNMLNFAGHHGIKPICETYPMSEKGIEDAISNLEKGQVRYRAVLLNESE